MIPAGLSYDERLRDPAGAPCTVSLVLTPPGVRIPMDDLAVQRARQAVLAGPPLDGVSVLLADDSAFRGSILVARGAQVARLADDPFARIFPAEVVEVGPGVFGALPMPAGPVIERYGSANPWPYDRF